MRFLGLLLAICAFAQHPGQPLPPWTPGTLDIHQINTGRGNAALLIFPDGTSMLLDAGDGGNLRRAAHPPNPTPPALRASGSPATSATCLPATPRPPWTTAT